MIAYDVMADTIIGDVCIAANENGLCAVVISHRGDFASRLQGMFADEVIRHQPDLAAPYRNELAEYFAGDRRAFSVPFDLASVRSSFQCGVLRRLVDVPFGSTVTYGELAALVGSPGAARAVGVTMAVNPLPIVVPCHRVVASDGLGGYSGGGVENKRRLLAHEGVTPPSLF